MTNKDYILLVGNYGHTNIGDMLLKKAAIQQYSESQIKVMSPAYADFPIFTTGFRSLIKHPLNNWKALRAIALSKKVVFGGGGLLNSQNKHSLLIWGTIILASLILRKPIALNAQSFSSAPKGLLKLMLKNVDVISVRDNLSQKHLDQAGIQSELVEDLALSLSTESIQNVFDDIKFASDLDQLPKTKYILLNARTYKALPSSVYFDLQDWVQKSEYQIIFTPFDIADVEFYNKYLKDLGVIIANPSLDLFESAYKIIGMRLHFLLVAKKLKLQFTPLSYAPKVIGMFGSKKCIDLYNYDKQKNPLK